MFGSKVVGSPSCSLGGKRTTQENAKDNSRHFDSWFWPQCGVQKRLCCWCLQDIAQCCIGDSQRFFLFKVDIVVHVKCLLFPPLHFLLLRNCCEKHGFNILVIGNYRVAACWTDWKYFHLTVLVFFFFCACMFIQEQYLTVHFIQYKNIVPSNGQFGKNKRTTLKNPLLKC